MIGRITRGARAAGLLAYLAGPGKANEHVDQRLIVGDDAVMAWVDDTTLGRERALEVARRLERPRRAFRGDEPGKWVWHASLSLKSTEGSLGDEKWAAIARDYVREMGFATTPEQPGCRWVAIHHGPSEKGNDHIHIVVSRVREDGSIASDSNDFYRSKDVIRGLERRYGLEVVESRHHGRGARGWHPAERARAEREGAPEPAGMTLARTVRASAAAAADEAEFVRRMRRSGLIVRPRYAKGTTDVVEGYSVARRPPKGEQPVWYGGGRLARDLTLPRLRADWPDTPSAASAAVAEWNAARGRGRMVAPGREADDPDPGLWEEYAADVAEGRELLHSVPVDDRDAWSDAARRLSGTFGAWSLRVEETAGPLAAISDDLARSAQMPAWEARRRRSAPPGASEPARLFASLPRDGPATVAQVRMARALANTAKALYDAHQAAGEVQRAASIERSVRTQLAAVMRSLPAVPPTAEEAATLAAGDAAGLAHAGSVRPDGRSRSPRRPATDQPRQPRSDRDR